MNKIFSKLMGSRIGASAFLGATMLSAGVANAANGGGGFTDVKSTLSQILGQILSFAGAFTVAGFITGCWCIFKIIVLITNYQEDARNNKLSGIIYYLIAGGMGFGFAFSSDVFRGTVWGSGSANSTSGIKDDVFQVNTK
ncbi:hypothetical protein [Photobacterium damselae]|uniref:hypothetical protein n=1 Tax=Photobacterium damselae TaxID=38293 RepID=UPI004068AC7E